MRNTAGVLVAPLSVPGSMASWDAGMLASCHLCPFILVAKPGRKVAQQALAPCVHPPGRVSEGPCQEGEWRGGRLESCRHVEAVLARLGLRVLLPALLGLMWQLCVWPYVVTVVHLANIS